MTWCAKIYDMFNGWSDEVDGITPTGINAINDQLPKYEHVYLENTADNIEDQNTLVIQHDSPFLEKSDSLANANSNNTTLQNDDYSNNCDYRQEYVSTNVLYSSQQHDGSYYGTFEQQPYTISTISNTSFDLPNYGRLTNTSLQQLTRSHSVEIPINFELEKFGLPSLRNIPSFVRYPVTEKMDRQIRTDERSSRLSLNQQINKTYISDGNQEDVVDYRVSKRSICSAPDSESSELQARNNEEIARAIQYYIKEMLASSPDGVYPMIYRLVSNNSTGHSDGYHVEGGYGEPSQWLFKTKFSNDDCSITVDDISSIYKNQFNEQYHYTLYAIDIDSNPIVMSVRPDNNKITVIVRTKDGSKCRDFYENEAPLTDYVEIAKMVYPNLKVEHFESCKNIKAPSYIESYDEKLETQKFKFGIIYQRKGQTTEEEFFNNNTGSDTFVEFLNIIASEVSLKNFKGYRGGLDVSEQTESPKSYYEIYKNKEIMFHVSTLLPYSRSDSTQIQRKRHIGNDIVSIVFQEENTPFHPSMIKSNFLHVFLVVQPVQILSRTCYKMMLISRDDILNFPPKLQENTVYVRTAENLKPFILSKLINGEYAAYRCRTFSLLQERTRCSFLKTLCEDLTEKSFDILCDEHKRSNLHRSSFLSNSARKRYLSSVKKMFTKSNSTAEPSRPSLKTKPSKKLLRLGKSMDSVADYQRSSADESTHPNESIHQNTIDHYSEDSTTSNCGDTTNSLQAYPGEESDEGLDSMSSIDANRAPYDSDDQDIYRQQIRTKSQSSHVWHRLSNNYHTMLPQTAGIHIREETTV